MRPDIAVGRGVKIFEGPNFGRQDAIATRVDNITGIIDVRTIRSGRDILNIVHSDDSGEGQTYWIELPVDFVPGSEGH